MFVHLFILLAFLQVASVFGSPVAESTLVTRSKVQPPICNIQGFPSGLVYEYSKILNYFRQPARSNSVIVVSPGCFRAACSGSSEVVMCNDNHHVITARFGDVAGYGSDIISRCIRTEVNQGVSGGAISKAVGQEFNTDGWNVILKGISGSDRICVGGVNKEAASQDGTVIVTLPGHAPELVTGEDSPVSDAIEFSVDEDSVTSDTQEKALESATALEARNTTTANSQILPPLCNVQSFPRANVIEVREIQADLYNKNARFGLPGRSTGPTYCLRIGCRRNSEMVVCNDNNHLIQPSSRYLATFANGIIDHCKTMVGSFWWVNGQEFDTDGFNVIIRGLLSSDPPCGTP